MRENGPTEKMQFDDRERRHNESFIKQPNVCLCSCKSIYKRKNQKVQE
jgi:hypothetical protein